MKQIIFLFLLASCTEHVCMEEFEKQPNITLEYLNEANLSELNTYDFWIVRADDMSMKIHYWNSVRCSEGVEVDLSFVLEMESEYHMYLGKIMSIYDLFIYDYSDGYRLCDDPNESLLIKIAHDSLRLNHSLFRERMHVTFISIDGIIDGRS